MLTKKKILKAVGNPFLEIVFGEGYIYFVYDSGEVYETKSIWVNKLNHLEFDSWVYECNLFIEELKKEYSGNEMMGIKK